MTTVAQYVADWIAGVNPRVYTVCGAGAMHLNDAICHHHGLQVTAMHHEQAAAFAAEADARVSGKPGIVHVTAGPGGTNTLTGIACAFVDSIPMVVIAGQVTSSTMHPPGVRQLGMNELDMVALAKPITKYAVTVKEPSNLRFELELALHLATAGRPGPVFIEIPLDVQAATIDPESLVRFYPEPWKGPDFGPEARRVLAALREAERPLLIVGNGVRLAGAVDEFRALIDRCDIPVVASWTGADIAPDHLLNVGRCGIFGDRAANQAVQQADLVLCIGTRLSVAQTGHARYLFARGAKVIVIDIDPKEALKPDVRVDVPIVADAKAFLSAMLREMPGSLDCEPWRDRCRALVQSNPVMKPEYRIPPQGINPYYFVERLGEYLPDDAIVITDVGFSFIPTMQSLKLKPGQRLFHSCGVSPMGYALAAAIGAARACPDRKVVCLIGDGGLSMNIQELQTVAHHQLPISIFVYDNGGYHTMRIAQQAHFGRLSVSDQESGLTCPDYCELAHAFGLAHERWSDHAGVDGWLSFVLGRKVPVLVQMHQQMDAVIAPRVHSRRDGAKFIPTGLESAA